MAVLFGQTVTMGCFGGADAGGICGPVLARGHH